MAIVEVKPIEKERWHGKKGRDAFQRPVTIEALVSNLTGKYSTGLSVEDQKRLEAETGFDLSSEYIPERAHPFWNTPVGFVKLENKTNVFDTKIPLNEIKVKLMKASDLVANSQKEYDEGKFPQALFVIFDETEDLEIRASKAAMKRKVIIEASKLPKSRKAEIIQILMGVSVRSQSEDFVDLKLDDCINEFGASKVLRLMQRDKKRTNLHALILEGIYKNVLRKEGTSIYYFDDQIGFDVESAIDHLDDPKNQAFKAQIIEKLS